MNHRTPAEILVRLLPGRAAIIAMCMIALTIATAGPLAGAAQAGTASYIMNPMYPTNKNVAALALWVNSINGVSIPLFGPAEYGRQCVEYVDRFYYYAMGYNTDNSTVTNARYWGGNGVDYYGSYATKKLLRYANGGTVPPKPGDILCFSGGLGHVAIVTSVGSGSVRIIEQNFDGMASTRDIAMTVASGRYTVAGAMSGMPCQGWLRSVTTSDPPPRFNPLAPGDPGFAKYGTPEGWRAIGGGLYGTGLWTYSGSGARDNYARWTFDLTKINGTRKYKAEAYVTSTHAGTTAADYHINTASGLVHKSVNQRVLSNQWANLGSYSFASGSAWVELDDVTGDGAGQEIAFDAIRLTPYFNLKYIAGTGGTIVGTTTQSILSGGSGTAVTAKPNTGFRFVKWSDGSTAATRTDTSVRADKTLTASFEALGLTVTQIAGTDRITTAIEASKKAFPSGASTVVIATALNWPDALGGSALAGAMRGPILLVSPNSLSPAVAAEIDRLNATKAIILGGTGAVSNDVYAALDALSGVSVERLAGANRYETSEKVAARTITEMKARSTYSGRAFVSTGQNFPDALGASPLAAAKGWPIYLTNPAAGDNSALATRMKSVGVTNVVVLGGTGAVSSAIESRMKATIGAALRIAGDTRYQTAANVASYGVSTAGLSWNRVGVATGQDFPDALAGGVLQGVSGSVMLLTPSSSLDTNARAALVTNKATISEVRYLGGTGVVTTAVRAEVEQVLR